MAILASLTLQQADGQPAATTSFDQIPQIHCHVLEPEADLFGTGEHWLEARFLIWEVFYQADLQGVFEFAFQTEEDEDRIVFRFGLIPGMVSRLAIDLKLLTAQQTLLPRSPGLLKATCSGRRLSRADIHRCRIGIAAGPTNALCLIAPPRFATEQPLCPVSDQALVDAFGQLEHHPCEHHITDEEQLGQILHREAAVAERPYPREWTATGCSRHERFDASGFFRTHHDGERWWLADTGGQPFFSIGANGISDSTGAAIVPGTESLYTWIPSRADPLEDCLSDHPSWSIPTVLYGRANLQRAFGSDWGDQWRTLTGRRLRRWRFNTIGCDSDTVFVAAAGLPYVLQLHDYPTTDLRLYRDFPDVFDPTFEDNAAGYAQQISERSEDRLLIGYFMADAPQWSLDQANLTSEMLEDHPGSHSRHAFATFLRKRYGDDSGAWCRSWKCPERSFDELVDLRLHRSWDRLPGAREDLDAFSTLLARRYANVPAAALRKVDPNHLNLGMRFRTPIHPMALALAGCFDVFSFCCFAERPDPQVIHDIAHRCRIPSLVAGFHFGAPDAGLLATGRAAVESQVERGIAYRNYFEAAAADPAVVGCHWSAWNDRPVLGRFDGECSQVGLVDVTHQPYKELVHAATLSHERTYRLHYAQVSAFDHEVRHLPANGI